jgi:hypothetical protein
LVLFGSQPELLALYAHYFPGVDYEVRPPQPYMSYLDAIAGGQFHFVLAPITEDTRFVRSKSPIKLLEATTAGAVLVASDVTPYEAVPDGTSCIKVAARPGAWTAALSRSLTMTAQERDAMWRSARDLVQRSFTTESQFLPFFTAHHAARLHAMLRARERPGGRAGILVVVPAEATRRRTALTWAWMLRMHHVRIVLVDAARHATAPAAAAYVHDRRPASALAAVLAPSPRSPWVEAARQVGLACAALADLDDVWPSQPAPSRGQQPGVLLMRSARAAELARSAGWRGVRRIGLPRSVSSAPATESTPRVAPVRIALVLGGDAPAMLASRVDAILTQQRGRAVLASDPARADVVVVAGNGATVVDATLAAMATGRAVIAADSTDADEMVVHRVSGWSTAAGEPLSDIIAEAIRSIGSGTPMMPRAAMATARARSQSDAIEHDLICAMCDMAATRDVANLTMRQVVGTAADVHASASGSSPTRRNRPPASTDATRLMSSRSGSRGSGARTSSPGEGRRRA